MMEKGQGFSWVSECGSGVESGWTYYLNESSYLCSGRSGVSRVTTGGGGKAVNGRADNDDDDEEGLSLVSDASSGPPHFEEEECENALFWKGRVVVGRERRMDSCFQDTASSGKVICESCSTLPNPNPRRMICLDHQNLQKNSSCLSRNEAPGFASLSKEVNDRNDPRCRHRMRSSSELASASKRL